eukprot:6072429-Pyramimonas_sp.AAC.1
MEDEEKEAEKAEGLAEERWFEEEGEEEEVEEEEEEDNQDQCKPNIHQRCCSKPSFQAPLPPSSLLIGLGGFISSEGSVPLGYN